MIRRGVPELFHEFRIIQAVPPAVFQKLSYVYKKRDRYPGGCYVESDFPNRHFSFSALFRFEPVQINLQLRHVMVLHARLR